MKLKSFKIWKICLLIKIKFLARKILYYNLILQALFQSAQHLYEKKGRIRIRTGTYKSGRPKNQWWARSIKKGSTKPTPMLCTLRKEPTVWSDFVALNLF